MAVTRVRYEVEGWGVAELCTDERGRVVLHAPPRPNGPHPPGWGGYPPPTPTRLLDENARRGADFVPALIARLRAYFAGERIDFADVSLELEHETPFGLRLAEELRRVPWGDVVTYGELAALAGRPGAARAAGTFCARCDLVPIVPLHRVVAAHGIGGFGSLGVSYKRRLLALERVAL